MRGFESHFDNHWWCGNCFAGNYFSWFQNTKWRRINSKWRQLKCTRRFSRIISKLWRTMSRMPCCWTFFDWSYLFCFWIGYVFKFSFRSNCHCEILVENWSESLKALDKLKKSKQRLLRSRKELGLDEISQLYNEILKEADLETERKKFPQCEFTGLISSLFDKNLWIVWIVIISIKVENSSICEK